MVGISDIGLLLLIICIIIILFPQVSVTFFLLGSHTFAIIPKSILRLGDDFGESGELLSQVVPEHKTLSPTCNYRNNYMLRSVKFQPLSLYCLSPVFTPSSVPEGLPHQPVKTPQHFCPECTPLTVCRFSTHPCYLKASSRERSACY